MKLLALSFLVLISANSFASTNKVLVGCTFGDITKSYTPNESLTKQLSNIPGIDVVYVGKSLDLVTVAGDANKPLTINAFSLNDNQVSFDAQKTIYVGEQIGTDDIEGTLIYNSYAIKMMVERRGFTLVTGTCSFEQ